MKRRRFFYKLLLGNLLLVGVIITLNGVISYRYLTHVHREENRQALEQAGRLAAIQLGRAWPQTPEQIHTHARSVAHLADASVLVVGEDWHVLADTDGERQGTVDLRNERLGEIDQALTGTPATRVRPGSDAAGARYHLAWPIVHDGRVVAALRISGNVIDAGQRRAFLSGTILWGLGAGVLLAVALSLLISWLWYGPLGQITQVAREIALGSTAAKVRVRGSDELAVLARALNRMRDRLAGQIEQLDAQRDNLQTVLGALREGLVALDAQGRIVLMNSSAIGMLTRSAEQIEGEHLQRVIRVPTVVDAYNEVQTSPGPIEREVDAELGVRSRRTLHLHAARVSNGRAREGIHTLLVVRDITDLARAASMKAQFVANASHELRTPLATIRATVESLHAFGPDDREAFEKFLGILDRHIARLEGMTNDLLDLHKVETSGYRIRRESIPLGSLVDWAEEHYAEQAQQRQVTFRASADEPQFVLKCDRALIQLVLQNLIDNGLKFTPPGGQVVLEIAAEPDAVVMTVRDTGCGIPPGEQTQVFERFYQVDPSRTGDSNIRGTGLGLAIVRHAAERLDAQVSLTSEPGKGTTFTVRLKA